MVNLMKLRSKEDQISNLSILKFL